jgi:hypothetical protein
VIGRKAWLFADTVNGAKASANLYGLIETAKANGLEPYRYLHYVFTVGYALQPFGRILLVAPAARHRFSVNHFQTWQRVPYAAVLTH